MGRLADADTDDYADVYADAGSHQRVTHIRAYHPLLDGHFFPSVLKLTNMM